MVPEITLADLHTIRDYFYRFTIGNYAYKFIIRNYSYKFIIRSTFINLLTLNILIYVQRYKNRIY